MWQARWQAALIPSGCCPVSLSSPRPCCLVLLPPWGPGPELTTWGKASAPLQGPLSLTSALCADSQSRRHCVGDSCEGCAGPHPRTGQWGPPSFALCSVGRGDTGWRAGQGLSTKSVWLGARSSCWRWAAPLAQLPVWMRGPASPARGALLPAALPWPASRLGPRGEDRKEGSKALPPEPSPAATGSPVPAPAE